MKSKEATPRCKQEFPKEFQEVQPHPRDENVFRDWADILDVHKGIRPIPGRGM
jgi:hypothetical protein